MKEIYECDVCALAEPCELRIPEGELLVPISGSCPSNHGTTSWVLVGYDPPSIVIKSGETPSGNIEITCLKKSEEDE